MIKLGKEMALQEMMNCKFDNYKHFDSGLGKTSV